MSLLCTSLLQYARLFVQCSHCLLIVLNPLSQLPDPFGIYLIILLWDLINAPVLSFSITRGCVLVPVLKTPHIKHLMEKECCLLHPYLVLVLEEHI